MSKPITVLELLVTTSPGGGPKHVCDLVRHLPRDEFELMVGAPRDGIFFDRFQSLGVRMVEFPLRQLGARHFVLATKLISSFRVDVVHTHGKGPGLYGRVAAGWTHVPAVHTFHGIHYSGYSRPGQRLYFAVERQLARLSHTIINVSASQEAEGLKLRLFRPEQSVVIVNGVDLSETERTLREARIRRDSLGLTPDDFVIGSISRFDPIKRVDLLLDAAQRLRTQVPRVVLVLVGGGGEETRIRRLVLGMSLTDRVIFTGFLENPARLYPAFDLYVAASLKEGLPLSVVEAMGAGLAVVATDVPGHRDVVVHGETGLLVPLDDAAALTDAIVSLMSDPSRRKAMGEAGRRRANSAFAVRPMVEATARVYRQAAASAERRPR